jgi:hypothetical protein
MVENGNDADTGTNAGRVKGEFLYSDFVRQVYVFRYPTAHSHPFQLTSKILALSDVENIILSGRYPTTLRYLQHSYPFTLGVKGFSVCHPVFLRGAPLVPSGPILVPLQSF